MKVSIQPSFKIYNDKTQGSTQQIQSYTVWEKKCVVQMSVALEEVLEQCRTKASKLR